MPCWTTTTVKTDVGKWNLERFNRVTVANNLYGVSLREGQLITREASPEAHQALISKVQRLYAELTIKDAAKRFGWRVAGTTVTKSNTTTIQLKRG